MVLIVLIFIALNGYDFLKAWYYHNQAKSLGAGNSMKQVREKLGKPTAVFKASKKGWVLSIPYERWAYGKIFDWRDCFQPTFPYIFPFRMRIFGPDKTDVTIVFGDDQKIQSIIIPPWSWLD